MTSLQPTVRLILTAASAALGVLVATVPNQTVRIIGGALIAGISAVGIVPPQIPTRTVLKDPTE